MTHWMTRSLVERISKILAFGKFVIPQWKTDIQEVAVH
jgi:hypothetical protein